MDGLQLHPLLGVWPVLVIQIRVAYPSSLLTPRSHGFKNQSGESLMMEQAILIMAMKKAESSNHPLCEMAITAHQAYYPDQL